MSKKKTESKILGADGQPMPEAAAQATADDAESKRLKDLGTALKSSESNKNKRQEMIEEETVAIWKAIGGKKSLAAATKMEKQQYKLLFHTVAGWYGLNGRVEELKGMASSAGIGANLAYNTNQILIRFIQKLMIHQFGVMRRVESDLAEIEKDPNIPMWGLQLVASLQRMSDPDAWGMKDSEAVIDGYKQVGAELFQEQRDDPEGSKKADIHEYTRDLIEAHKETLQESVFDEASKSKSETQSGE